MTRQEFIPREYQKDIVEHIINTPRCAIWAGMGMGKTVATLTALAILSNTESAPALVIAPLRVAKYVWPEEVLKWNHLADVVVVSIRGDQRFRRQLLLRPANIYTINYEHIPWLVEHCGSHWPFRTVVADESTRLKSFRKQQGGKRAGALGAIAHEKIDRFIELTGTPTPNGLQDLWGQSWFLDKGARLGKTFWAFRTRWFHAIQMGSSVHAVRWEPQPCAMDEVEEKLHSICVSFDASDHFDVAAPIVNIIRVKLPTKARGLYEGMERRMFLELDCGKEIEAVHAASRTIKCLQLANGAIYTDEKGSEFAEVHDAKIQAVKEVVEEAAGMPVLVAYHFRSDLVRLQRAFSEGRSLGNDPQTISDWNAGKIPVLFAHPASAGHGLNLQDGGNILVFFAHWWNLEQYQQIIERIGPTRQAQSGHKRPVFIHHIVADNTIDELVLERRDSKRTVQDILLAAMRRRGLANV